MEVVVGKNFPETTSSFNKWSPTLSLRYKNVGHETKMFIFKVIISHIL
jgi:hypothetical protein